MLDTKINRIYMRHSQINPFVAEEYHEKNYQYHHSQKYGDTGMVLAMDNDHVLLGLALLTLC